MKRTLSHLLVKPSRANLYEVYLSCLMHECFISFFFLCFCSVHLTCLKSSCSRAELPSLLSHYTRTLKVPDMTLRIVLCGLEDDLLLVCYSLVLFVLTCLLIIIYIVFFFFNFICTPYCIMTLLVFTSIVTVLPLICKFFHYDMK